MEKTAIYNGKVVYVEYITNLYVLVSYNQDMVGKFKVQISDLKDIKFDIKK